VPCASGPRSNPASPHTKLVDHQRFHPGAEAGIKDLDRLDPTRCGVARGEGATFSRNVGPTRCRSCHVPFSATCKILCATREGGTGFFSEAVNTAPKRSLRSVPRTLRSFSNPPCHCCINDAWLDNRHKHTKRFHFSRKRFAHRFQRPLRRGISS